MTENRMELFIETLTGTAFELSCSPLETIVSIKAKIQYLEGIPVSQQHLIWRSEELSDDLCLQDYCISDGATLRLVLGMRGGPINTRQVSSDNKKFKDLSDYVERQSESSSSGNRPFTVLVFHDGDKVHMYTLTERGDCTVSPLSGAISETSSITSVKNVEEVDEDIINENKITMEKMARLQDQIRALNLNRSKRNSSTLPKNIQCSTSSAASCSTSQEFHLPPLGTVGSYNSLGKQFDSQQKYSMKPPEKSYFSRFVPNKGIRSHTLNLPPDCEESDEEDLSYSPEIVKGAGTSKEVFNLRTNSIPSNVCTPEFPMDTHKDHIKRISSVSNSPSQSSSNLLPYMQSSQLLHKSSTERENSFLNNSPQNSQTFSMNNMSPNIIKYKQLGLRKLHKQLPITSNQAASTQRYIDLDQWIESRPKTSPEEYMCKPLNNFFGQESYFGQNPTQENRVKMKLRKTSKHPLSLSFDSGEKAKLIMKTFTNNRDVQYDFSSSIVCKSKSKFSHNHTHSKANVGNMVTSGLKGMRPLTPKEISDILNTPESQVKNSKSMLRPREGPSRPQSGKKLPLIKAKKKSYKRCTLCSKRTGLATSYTCRCGKNFCASHRYAEVHHCSYDYKTEGRRLLQLNNPVVTASKLPKI